MAAMAPAALAAATAPAGVLRSACAAAGPHDGACRLRAASLTATDSNSGYHRRRLCSHDLRVLPRDYSRARRRLLSASQAPLMGQGLSFQGIKRQTARTKAAAIRSEEQLAADEVTIDNSTVLVVGGGGVGMEVVRQAAAAGSWVTAFQRGEKFRQEIEQLGSMLALGDVLDVPSIEKVLRSNSTDAVLSSVGGGMTDINVDSEGNINLIDAAKKAGVQRFVLVSSIGAGASAQAVPENQMQALGPVLEEKEKAEAHLMSSGLKWTIIRPGGLLSEAATGNGFLTEDESVVGVITRADVATLILQILFDKKAESKILAALDGDKLWGKKDIEKFAVA
eukprot:SM000056S17928  [mRNA]  locus=s56:156474:159363:- [translate_table: standard]